MKVLKAWREVWRGYFRETASAQTPDPVSLTERERERKGEREGVREKEKDRSGERERGMKA